VNRFLACFLATHTGILSSISSIPTRVETSTYNGMLPYHPDTNVRIRSFGGELESRELSAQNHLTSEQLRTL
jgi:hypothetical protein